MANEPEHDEPTEELREEIARSRERLTRDLSGLRYELDFPRKIRRSFQTQTVLWLAAAGVAGVLAGFLWGLQFPVIKKIWTSSYVLVAGGFSALLLGAFYLLVDLWQFRKWCQPFVWIGMNSITVYLANNVIGFHHLAARFAGGDIQKFFDAHVTPGFGDLIVELIGLGLALAFVYFLYRKKIFLRL